MVVAVGGDDSGDGGEADGIGAPGDHAFADLEAVEDLDETGVADAGLDGAFGERLSGHVDESDQFIAFIDQGAFGNGEGFLHVGGADLQRHALAGTQQALAVVDLVSQGNGAGPGIDCASEGEHASDAVIGHGNGETALAGELEEGVATGAELVKAGFGNAGFDPDRPRIEHVEQGLVGGDDFAHPGKM